MRLFLISLGTLTITLIIGLIVRFWGLSLPYKQFEHPFFDSAKTQPQMLRIPVLNPQHFDFAKSQTSETPTFSPKEMGHPSNIVWINIYLTSDRKLISDYAFNENDFQNWVREKNKFKGKFIHNYSLNEIKEFAPEIVLLETVISQFKNSLFVFNVLSNETDVHKDIIAVIENNKLSDRVLVNSPVDVVIKAIKEQKPMWAYGTSLPEATRLKSFSTVGLEPAISIRGDVFIAPMSYMNRTLMDESLVTEMKRRKKFVFIGPVNNDEEKKLAEDMNPDGIIF